MGSLHAFQLKSRREGRPGRDERAGEGRMEREQGRDGGMREGGGGGGGRWRDVRGGRGRV